MIFINTNARWASLFEKFGKKIRIVYLSLTVLYTQKNIMIDSLIASCELLTSSTNCFYAIKILFM